MTSEDIIYNKIHFRHDSKWSGRLGPAEGGGLLCVACVIEMLEKLLHTAVDPILLEKADQVLVLLLSELQSELSYHFVLDQIHRQLNEQLSVKCFLPTFTFLGRLLEAVPDVAQTLMSQYVPLLELLCSAWLYPDEGLKASVIHVWVKLLGAAGVSAVPSMPTAVKDSVCKLLLQSLASASSPQLINNCTGLLWLLVQCEEAVSLLMNEPGNQTMCSKNQNIHSSQTEEQQSPAQCHLPLMLKKLLLSGDEGLLVTSTKCIAFVLVHSPPQYSAPFIKADVPEFLFDRLASTNSEVLLWSVYSCLLLLIEDPLFFTQCHSVYGFESLLRSLKEALLLTNLDVAKQGLRLLTEILERQPPAVCLIPSGSGFVAVSEAVLAGVSSSCLLVATQAASSVSALFRLNHQSRPVQYRELQLLVEAVTNRLSELSLPSSAHRRGSKSKPNSQVSISEGFLLQALVCFQTACRLAEECASEPLLKENVFTALSKPSATQDSHDSLCQCLLRCCDSVWIPTVVRFYEYAPNPQSLQLFYSILSSQFTLLPSLMPIFANKLASSGFYRLALEHKGLFCSGNRNPTLNESCCTFLQKLSICLLSRAGLASGFYQHDVEEVETLLRFNLPPLCCRLSDWPSLLCESPGLQLCDHRDPRATQYCLLIILHLALQQGDSLLPLQTVFTSVVRLLRSVQEQAGCPLPPSVLRSGLYLLAVTQDQSTTLDGASLNWINKALCSCQSFSSLYVHHPALLHFICRYPELAQTFGPLALELWLTTPALNTGVEQNTEKKSGSCKEETDTDAQELLSVLEKFPAVILILLDMVCSRAALLAQRALTVLELHLRGQRDYEAELCCVVKPAVLQALQRISVDNVELELGHEHAPQVNSLPLVLRLLCVTHSTPSSSDSKMDGVNFKLLYHVTNIAGRLKPTDTECLLPAISYLYCCLSSAPAHCMDTAVAMLLSNQRLIDQLQTLLSSSSSSPPAGPPSALLCSSHLLLSSLVTLQHVQSAQVLKSISWRLDTAVERLLVQKRHTDNLLLVSYLRVLQALLNVDLASALVTVCSGSSLVGPRPLESEDGALYPLGFRGARCLAVSLSGLIIQKHELLLRSSVSCLCSLLGFLRRKKQAAAEFVVCQPWSRFLLHCLLSSGEQSLLHPAVVRFITLLMQHSSAVVQEAELQRLMDALEGRGSKELSQEETQTLRLLLQQVQRSPPTEEHGQRARRLMEALGSPARTDCCRAALHSNILRVGDVSVCLWDFTVQTD